MPITETNTQGPTDHLYWMLWCSMAGERVSSSYIQGKNTMFTSCNINKSLVNTDCSAGVSTQVHVYVELYLCWGTV